MALPLELGGIEDQYVRRAFEQISTAFPIQDINLASPQNGVWRPLFRAEPMRTVNATGTTLVIAANSDGIGSGGAGNNIAHLFQVVGSDLAVTGKTVKMRVSALIACNATAPACTFTYALRPVTVAGGAGVGAFTAGAVTGNSVAIASPSASTMTFASGTEFTIPSDGTYSLTTVASVAQALNSFTVHNIVLEYRYA